MNRPTMNDMVPATSLYYPDAANIAEDYAVTVGRIAAMALELAEMYADASREHSEALMEIYKAYDREAETSCPYWSDCEDVDYSGESAEELAEGLMIEITSLGAELIIGDASMASDVLKMVKNTPLDN